MSNKYMDTALFDKATMFAVNAHSNTERRGKKFPYLIHLMEAAVIVATVTNDQEILAAALLHDTIEDTDVTPEQLEENFGPRVRKLVETESDIEVPGMSSRDSWRIRKESAILRLKNASRDEKIVALGDKLSNMRAIARDYRSMGEDVWNTFHVTDPKEHAWHYYGLMDSLSELSDTEAFNEFKNLVETIYGRYL